MPKEVEKKGDKQHKKGQPVRLYVKGAFTGFKRSRRAQHEGQALVQIENVRDRASARWYLGKRVAFIYKAKVMKNNTRYRVKWGKVISQHGSAGKVRAQFKKNLPAQSMGAQVRVMLYPNRSV